MRQTSLFWLLRCPCFCEIIKADNYQLPFKTAWLGIKHLFLNCQCHVDKPNMGGLAIPRGNLCFQVICSLAQPWLYLTGIPGCLGSRPGEQWSGRPSLVAPTVVEEVLLEVPEFLSIFHHLSSGREQAPSHTRPVTKGGFAPSLLVFFPISQFLLFSRQGLTK